MSSTEVTALLGALQRGDDEAINQLFPVIYEELRQVAHRQLRLERTDHTLNTTALVHEVYLRMVDRPPEVDWDGRSHFLSIAARAMRQVLVNYAKAKRRLKRGDGVRDLPFDENIIMPSVRPDALIALDDALERLGKIDARQVSVVECRYFGGLTVAETAKVLSISVATANRDWTTARMWLKREVYATLDPEAINKPT